MNKLYYKDVHLFIIDPKIFTLTSFKSACYQVTKYIFNKASIHALNEFLLWLSFLLIRFQQNKVWVTYRLSYLMHHDDANNMTPPHLVLYASFSDFR